MPAYHPTRLQLIEIETSIIREVEASYLGGVSCNPSCATDQARAPTPNPPLGIQTDQEAALMLGVVPGIGWKRLFFVLF